MVTSRDVARLAGVSQPTVSRALRDGSKISEDTKKRVRDAARALGYSPNAIGRALAVGHSHRVGLILTDLENQFYPHVIAPIHHQLEQLGYELVLLTETSENSPIVDRVVANGLCAVILATTTVDSALPVRLSDRGVPFLYFNRTTPAVASDSVTVDPEPGMRELLEEIASLGHRRIGAVFGPHNTSTGEERESTLRMLLEQERLELRTAHTVHGPFDVESGSSGARSILSQDDRPTVIVCANDVVAIGALNAASELGLSVPEDVSIVGFDDLPMARWAFVWLSTIAYDLNAMSREAARLVVARVENDPAGQLQHSTYPTRFIRRGTLAAPRK